MDHPCPPSRITLRNGHVVCNPAFSPGNGHTVNSSGHVQPHLAQFDLRQVHEGLKPLREAGNSHDADIPRCRKTSVLSTLPPRILGLGITRASHPPFSAPRVHHLGPRVTASHRAAGRDQHGRCTSQCGPATERHLTEGAAPGKGRIVRHRSLLVLTTVITTGALTLTACGSRDEAKSGDKTDGKKTVVVIGVDAPSPARFPPSARASRTRSTSRPRRPTRTTRSPASSSRSRPSTTRRSPPPVRPTPPSSSATRTSSASSAR